MPSFWPRLLVHGLTWLVLVMQVPAGQVPVAMMVAALYLGGYFVSQLHVAAAPLRSAGRGVACLAALVALVMVAPHASAAVLAVSAFLLLVPPLVEEAVTSASRWSVPVVLGASAVSLTATMLLLVRHGASPYALGLLGLAALVVGSATAAFRRTAHELGESVARYGALLSEYRELKRVSAASADAARAEERISVARRLHDSVGQRLTSLLMQLEVARAGAATEEQRQRAVDLKRLAQASLDETREAVTALTEDELAGMPALLRLIHNLEVESAMQIELTVGSGAMSVRLDREPAIALYRAVQEALTNAMRHGGSRRARVSLEAPGGRLLRFEVVNDITASVAARTGASAAGPAGAPGTDPGAGDHAFRPGFGLTAMRQRVEAAGGQLEIVGNSGQFRVRGSFPLGA